MDSIDAKYPVIHEKGRGLVWVALLACMVIAGFAVFNYSGAQDNDQWWLMATGRYIVENGIPYINPFDAYGDQAIVVQQWIPCVIDYVVYEAFGYVGFGILVLAMIAIVVVLAAMLGRCVMDRTNIDLTFCFTALAVGVCSAYMSIRPQMWSMIAFLAVLNVMERYRRSDNWKILIALPVIVAVHANFHLSMMPFDFFIVACYLLPRIRLAHFETATDNYRRLPIIAALAAMALASLANPYGIDGALYLLNSYDSASYGNYISEMGTTPIDTYYGTLMVAMMVVGSIAIGHSGLRKVNLPVIVLFLVTLALSFQHTRNVWLVAVFALPLVFSSLVDFHLEPRLRFLKDDIVKAITFSAGVFLVLLVGISMMTEDLVKEPSDGTSTPVAAADWLDSNAESDVTVFTHFNSGGYLEWRGYRVGMDARPELWNSPIAKNGHDRYKEYIDMSKKKMSSEDYMADKDFDYMIVNTDTELYKYLLASSDYRSVKEGEGYVLFARGGE